MELRHLRYFAAVAASEDRIRTLGRFVGGFNKLAVGSVMVVTITGLYNTWIHVEGFSALVGSTYGWVLLAKVAVSVPE